MTLLEQIQRAGIALPLGDLSVLVRRIVERSNQKESSYSVPLPGAVCNLAAISTCL